MGTVTPITPAVRAGTFSPPAPIRPEHQTGQFSCGKPPLDDWLKYRALKSEGRSARTYVVCAGDEVVGYYCLATGSVRLAEFPPKIAGDLPNPVPVILIGRLAVASSYQGMKIGKGLLRDALLRAVHVSQQAGCRAVMVHAIDADAAAFYSAFGFITYRDGERTFFMSMKQIAAAL